jgi:drug/metabolite transporter (DMT)-like permease
MGWILTLIPPVTGLIGWMFLKEAISLKQVSGLIIAMIGVVFFVSKGEPTKLSFVRNIGDALALTSVVTWSVYTVLTKSRLSTYDPLPVSAIHMALGFGAFLLIGGWGIPAEVVRLDGRDWVIIVLIGIIPSGLAYYWWNAGLKRLSAVNTATFLFIEAIVASLAGFLLLGELFTVSMVVAAFIIVVGVSITQARRA